jgi:hypothetical protein
LDSKYGELVARDLGSGFIAGYLASFVTRPSQRGIEFAADHLFDELTRPSPYFSLDRSNQLSKRSTAISVTGCIQSGFVVKLGYGVTAMVCSFRDGLNVGHGLIAPYLR